MATPGQPRHFEEGSQRVEAVAKVNVNEKAQQTSRLSTWFDLGKPCKLTGLIRLKYVE